MLGKLFCLGCRCSVKLYAIMLLLVCFVVAFASVGLFD